MINQERKRESAWGPFKHSLFRMLWLASFFSNIGTLMQSVGASWLMTTLRASALLVSLVQTAVNLPTFLLALPAGALADVIDRRNLLLFTQAWMALAAGLLGLLTLLGRASPATLLLLTFSSGLGAALNAPAWQAIVPELVPREEVGAAVALNSAGFNLARAAGPALGGWVVASWGPGATFLLNALSFIGVILVVFVWRRPAREEVLPAERFMEAMTTGVRYARHATQLHPVFVRAGSFIVFASALWAFLPLIARFELHLAATGYGILLGFFGAGAVLGAVFLPELRRWLSPSRLLFVHSLLFALGTLVPALVPNVYAVGAALFAAGVSWLVLLSTFNVSVQTTVPAWVRGRALAIYLLIVFGGLAIGSAFWGAAASRFGLVNALFLASAGMGIVTLATARQHLPKSGEMDLAPSDHWPAPAVAMEPLPEDGPVFVTVEYRIDPARMSDFARAMREVRRIRLRDGALRWNLLQDTADPSRVVESFVATSWLEHMRQHGRLTSTTGPSRIARTPSTRERRRRASPTSSRDASEHPKGQAPRRSRRSPLLCGSNRRSDLASGLVDKRSQPE